jgi:hypothetical protein
MRAPAPVPQPPGEASENASLNPAIALFWNDEPEPVTADPSHAATAKSAVADGAVAMAMATAAAAAPPDPMRARRSLGPGGLMAVAELLLR